MSNYSDAYDPQITMEDLGQPTRAEAQADMYPMTNGPARTTPIYDWRDKYTAEELAEIERAKAF